MNAENRRAGSLRPRTLTFGLCTTLLMFALGCEQSSPTHGDATGASDDAPLVEGEVASGVTYQKDIRPLIENSCLDCHVAGGMAPFSLDTFAKAKASGASAAHAVSTGLMPPSGWNESCHRLNEDRSLTAAQRKLFTDWQAAGFPEGNASDYVAPPARSKKVLGEPNIVMKMSTPYTPPTGADEYRCFILGTVQKDTYLTGLQITPQAVPEVHHIIIHRVNASALQQARQLDQLDAKPGYVCNGGAGVSAQNMFSYRPGSEAVTFGPGDAAYLEAGSTMIIQVHYNTVFLTAGNKVEPDQSQIGLWTLPDGQLPERVVYRTTTFGPVNIPAGNGHVVSNISRTMRELSTLNSGSILDIGGLGGPSFPGLPGVGASGDKFIPGEIIGMTPHAHQLATQMNASLKHAGGSSTCLDDVKWDFHWQLDYIFDKGVPYSPDDTFTASCTYDNSAANQPVVNGVKQRPRTVTFGERTIDEMCEHYIWLRFTRAAFLAAKGK